MFSIGRGLLIVSEVGFRTEGRWATAAHRDDAIRESLEWRCSSPLEEKCGLSLLRTVSVPRASGLQQLVEMLW